jgi:sugar phosphate isomerase/epimerase
VSLRFGYGLNGFTDHRLEDALAVVADLGYDGVALTLDHAHLDPFAPDLKRRTARMGRLLARHGLAVVVETGARYVLDPRRKHFPTLVSDEGRERRIDLLNKAVRIASELGAPAVSFWSGIAPDGSTAEECWTRLEDGVSQLLPVAEAHDVDLALEPEPGMHVERIADVHELRRRLGSPRRLRLTVDVGHLRCTEDESPARCIVAAAPLIANVQIDDMRRGVHEHLPFGEGEVDFPAVLGALGDADFAGLVAVELPRHSHAAPALAGQSIAFLRAAEAQARATRPTPPNAPSRPTRLQEVAG